MALKRRASEADLRLRSAVLAARFAQMRERVLKLVLMVGALSFSLALSACAGWSESDNDAVRRAVAAHELAETGTHVDDLVIRLSPREFRPDLGHDGRTIWLVSNGLERKYREGEYFRLRDPGRSYLFIHDIQYDQSGNSAQVTIVLYLVGEQPLTKDLTLGREGDNWRVVSETPAR